MAKVSIVMGSDSDLKIMSQAAKVLSDFGIEYEMKIISAHRMPDIFVDYAKSAQERGVSVIIAGAGGAAHLPGMCAALLHFRLSECLFIQRVFRELIHFIQLYRCRQAFL